MALSRVASLSRTSQTQNLRWSSHVTYWSCSCAEDMAHPIGGWLCKRKCVVQIPSTKGWKKQEKKTSEGANLLWSWPFSFSTQLFNRINTVQELPVTCARYFHWLLSVWSCTQRQHCIPSYCISSVYMFFHIFQVSLVQTLHLTHEYAMTTFFQQILLIGKVHQVVVPQNSNWHLTGSCSFETLFTHSQTANEGDFHTWEFCMWTTIWTGYPTCEDKDSHT